MTRQSRYNNEDSQGGLQVNLSVVCPLPHLLAPAHGSAVVGGVLFRPEVLRADSPDVVQVGHQHLALVLAAGARAVAGDARLVLFQHTRASSHLRVHVLSATTLRRTCTFQANGNPFTMSPGKNAGGSPLPCAALRQPLGACHGALNFATPPWQQHLCLPRHMRFTLSPCPQPVQQCKALQSWLT